MENQYKIRAARDSDKIQIHQVLRESIAKEKKLIDPNLLPYGFLEEFVDKRIKNGSMLVVENALHEMEMIGEVHDYRTSSSQDSSGGQSLQELSFISRTDRNKDNRETDLVNWLFGEIRNNYREVFRVELNTPVSSSATVDHYKNMGLVVKGNYLGRLKSKTTPFHLLVPLSWINPS